MAGPLDGIRVLEFSQVISGPYTGVNLADLGADVVKVEPPGGESSRQRISLVPGETKWLHALNRGKRSLVVDLRTAEGRDLIRRIVPAFDVVLTNSRIGVMRRLGLDYRSLREVRPDLIYCDITGFGTQGPGATRAGSDIIAQAYSGLLAAEAKLDETGGPELIQCTGIVDFSTSFAAAMGICAALFHRERTGEGQYVSTSLLITGMTLMGREISRSATFDAAPGARDEMMARIDAIRARGGSYAEVIEERGGVYKLLGPQLRLFYGGHPVKDGAIIFGALTAANRQAIRDIVGLTDDPTADPNFDGRDPANYARVMDTLTRMRALLARKTTEEWLALFDAAGVPASRVNLPEELAHDPQAIEAGLLLDVEHELTGPERFVGPLVQMSATPTGAQRPSPPLARHTDEVLAECGLNSEQIAALRAAGAIA